MLHVSHAPYILQDVPPISLSMMFDAPSNERPIL